MVTLAGILTSPPARRRLLDSVTGADSRLSFAAAGTLATSLTGVAGRFVLQLAIAGVMGTSSYGIFVTFRAWGEFLANLPNRGYLGATVRYLPVYEAQKRWGPYRGLQREGPRITVVGGVVIGIVAAIVGTAIVGETDTALLLGFATVPGWAAIRMLQALLQAQHQFVTASLVNELLQPAVLGVGVDLVWLATDTLTPTQALLLLFASLGAAAAAGASAVRRATPAAARTVTPDITERAEWRSTARPLFVSQLAIAVNGMAAVLILSFFVSSREVALYAVAARIAAIGGLANTGLESVVSPRIATAWGNRDIDGIQRSVNNSIALSTVPTVGFTVVVAVLAGPLLSVVGEDYREASTVLVILLIGNIVNALTGPSGYVVSLTGNERVHATIMTSAAAALVVACLALAGTGGIVAVAWASTAVRSGWNLALVWFARRELGVRCYPNRGILRGQF